jgi:hypothetical protein
MFKDNIYVSESRQPTLLISNNQILMIKILKHILVGMIMLGLFSTAFAQTSVQIALLKYSGGGDWYANPTSLPNLIKFCNENLGTNIHPEPATVDIGSPEIINYPVVHITGHGNIVLSGQDVKNLREYLIGGGFLHVSDNYGLDQYIRREMKKVFPETDFVELPFNHDIFNGKYAFKNGLPKIHEHDGKPPQGFALFYEDRMVCFYDYECDLGDGWEDPAVHNNTKETQLKALEMGANIIQFVFTQ